jgi:hypothetical protein
VPRWRQPSRSVWQAPGLLRLSAASRAADNPAVAGQDEHIAGPDPVRASDAERDQVLGELRERFAEGRLTQDTFDHRVDAALRARARGELAGLLADLPPRRRLGASLRSAVASSWRSSVGSSWRRALAAADRWLRKPPGTLVLPKGPQRSFTIGREPGCDLTLADQTVSRRHASLAKDAEGWLLSDLGSTNGTRLNGWRVRAPVLVSPGDLVSFGAATFVLTERPPRRPAAAPTAP